MALTNAAGTDWFVSGGTVSAPLLANINGGQILVSDGVTLALPTVTSYTHTSGDVRNGVALQASGVGSVLELRNALSVTTGTTGADSVSISALAGGAVDLRSVVQLVDPATGDTRSRAILVTADGANSRVDLTALAQMTDQNLNDDYNTGVTYSRPTAQNLGRIVANPAQIFVTNVFVLTELLGTITGNVVLGPRSTRVDR